MLQVPGRRVDSYVLPLIASVVKRGDSRIHAESVEGTGFLLARGRGLGVTARHVAAALEQKTSIGDLFRPETDEEEFRVPGVGFIGVDGMFRAAPIVALQLHPTEDVALFRLADDDYYSPYTISAEEHDASDDYSLWGYPDDVRHDYFTEQARPLNVPLVYSSGHVRRRVSSELPVNNIRGKKFYELSTPAGSCASGSPVAERSNPWRVAGVYVGERRNETGSFAVGFGTRAEAILDEWPQLAEHSADWSTLCPLPPEFVENMERYRFRAEVNTRRK